MSPPQGSIYGAPFWLNKSRVETKGKDLIEKVVLALVAAKVPFGFDILQNGSYRVAVHEAFGGEFLAAIRPVFMTQRAERVEGLETGPSQYHTQPANPPKVIVPPPPAARPTARIPKAPEPHYEVPARPSGRITQRTTVDPDRFKIR